MRALKLVVAIVLTAVATFSFGQTVSCLPSTVGGSGSRLYFEEDAVGITYGWWCADQYVPPKMYIVTGRHADFLPEWKKIGLGLITASQAERDAAWAKYVTPYPKNADGGLIIPADLFPVHMLVWTAMTAEQPPVPVWKVAPNIGYTTRPAYSYSNGIRATVATARANVDATCYCDTRVVSGSTTYCAVNVARTWMSVCTRR